MNQPIIGIARIVGGLSSLLLCSCASVDHSREIQQAQERVTAATGRRPDWAVDAPLRTLTIAPSGQLEVENAIQLALANNRALRADLEVLAQAKAELVQAGLLPNPMLSVMFGFPEAGGLSNFAFGLSQDLAALWLIPIRERIAHTAVQQRILMLADNAVSLTADVRIAYASAQYQRLAARFQEDNLAVLVHAMAVTESRIRVGGAQLDLNLIRGRHVQAEIELLETRNEYRLAQRTLLRIMGVAMASDEWVTAPLPVEQAYSRLVSDETKLAELALVQRLDAQAAAWEMEGAIADIENERRRLLPTLEVGIAGERFERRALPDRDVLADTARASIAAGQLTAPMIESAGERRKERAQEIEFILGPSLDIPIPIFDQNQAQIARAQHRAREMRERYEEVQQRIVESVRKAAATRHLQEERVARYREVLLPLQRSNLELAEAAYQAGREAVLAVLVAQEALISAQLEYASALRDLEVAGAELERQVSATLPEFMLRASSTSPASQPGSDQERQE